MKNFAYISFYLVSMAIMFLCMRSCCGTAGVIIKHDTTYKQYVQVIHDTPVARTVAIASTKKPSLFHRDKTPPIIDTEYVQNPMGVDSQGIVKAYFENLYYSDTVHTAYGNEVINDTVSRNHIEGRSVATDFKFPQTSVERIINRTIPPQRKILIGFDIGFGIGAGGAYQDRKDRLYGADYFFTQHGGILMATYKRVLTFR